MPTRLKAKFRKEDQSIFYHEGDEQGGVGYGACPMVGAIKTVVSIARLLVIRHLFTGPKRFNELLRVSGINSKTLSATLKSLEDRKVVKREVVSTRPFIVQYSLTESGLELKPVLEGLGAWGMKWLQNKPEPRRSELDRILTVAPQVTK